ncbi:MAG: helix-turn-helix transcriptional regulator [Candidatus Aminicenantes bacterium]|nr:helix-turn-helix transcriptional regulator [Candidatus Aminicenantes bacterium]
MISKNLAAASTKPIILALLSQGEDYGYQIIQKVKTLSGGTLDWSDNMLYPVLRRLEETGLVVSRWRISAGERLRKYYRITETGREELEAERRQWSGLIRSLQLVWDPLLGRE